MDVLLLPVLFLHLCRHSVNRSLVLLLQEEGHSKKANCTFLLPLVTSKHSFGFFRILKYKLLKCQLYILKKFLMKEAKNWTLEAIILKFHLAVRLCVCDIILSNLKLVGSTKICR